MAEPAMEGLPLELICEITANLLEHTALGSVAALAQCSRRLSLVLPLLHDHVARVSLAAGEDALVWAAENDELATLQSLLDHGVDPNARFWSVLPGHVRHQVLAAQRRPRRLAPALDGHLISKLLQEEIVWCSRCEPVESPDATGKFYRAWYMATLDGTIPDSFPVMPEFIASMAPGIDQLVSNARFGCRQRALIKLPDRRPYSWTALHAAAKRGNIEAVKSLLAHGAQIESKCEGLCGCLTPTCHGPISGEHAPSSGERPPTWTALHLAVCFGHQDLVRLLLSRGANHLDVGEMSAARFSAIPDAQGAWAGTRNERPPITAFHTAALKGNVDMCRLLLDHHVAFRPDGDENVLDRRDSKEQRPIDYAVAAGHTRTAAAWLLEQRNGNRPLIDAERHASPTVLHFLCYRGRYRDAQFLLERTRPSAEGCTQALHMCFATKHAVLSVPYKTRLGSLEVFVDEYMEDVMAAKRRLPQHDSEEDLISLAKQLLTRGADPGAIIKTVVVDPWARFRAIGRKSAFQLAASAGHLEVAELLLKAGAPLDLGDLDTSAAVSQNLHTPLDMRACLAATVTFLERGAAVRHWPPEKDQEESSVQSWFRPWFEPYMQKMSNARRRMWYDSRCYDLFERLMEVSAKRLGKDHFPTEWIAELLSIAVAVRGSTGDFCKWLIQHYNVVPTDLPEEAKSQWPTMKNPGRYASQFVVQDTLVAESILDLVPDTATQILHHSDDAQVRHPASEYARRGFLSTAKLFLDRGLADEAPPGIERPGRRVLRRRFQYLILQGVYQSTKAGAADLINAVVDRPFIQEMPGADTLLLLDDSHFVSETIIKDKWNRTTDPETKRVLRAVLRIPCDLYGIQARKRGENPALPPTDEYDRAFFYPVPVAIFLGNAALLEVIFEEKGPPDSETALEVLCMALDATANSPHPAVVETILKYCDIPINGLVARPETAEETDNGITGYVTPLYYLLKTFYKAHVIPPSSNTGAATDGGAIWPRYNCTCALVTKGTFLVRCIAALVARGADWSVACLPDGETALEVLEKILDGEGCGVERGGWPGHNWERLRRCVKLDWRKSGREVAAGFNPVEVEGVVEARWALEGVEGLGEKMVGALVIEGDGSAAEGGEAGER
ncbi:hypothetical protein C8A05DRAFT_37430 [Staphylotrichum tortipilum]|uniref:Ankyrin repeat protein n=1 Tax=Staphylotrichum tortipilum TaxID=2831512 RepID=A0AAN6MED2_9PEZI|nr:hypothetical protein C8A05DRAFT_37430 [Staphylotrichum longicolle]